VGDVEYSWTWTWIVFCGRKQLLGKVSSYLHIHNTRVYSQKSCVF
jgi:hypothetical protein